MTSQQSQRDVPVPTLPPAHLILIETAFAFGRLKPHLYFPAPASDVDQRLPRGLAARCIYDVIRMLSFLIKAAPHQQIMPEATLFGGEE